MKKIILIVEILTVFLAGLFVLKTPAWACPAGDVACGKSAWGTGAYYPYSNALDGDYGNMWNAGGLPFQQFAVDLGSEMSVNKVKLLIAQLPAGNTNHVVFVAGNDWAWRNVATFNGWTTDGQWLEANFGVQNNVRYVAINSYSSPSWIAWREVEVYTPSQDPVGYHDSANGGSTCVLSGWTCDGDNWSRSNPVDVWINDGTGFQWVGSTSAGDWREDAVKSACGGVSNYHGFNYSIPASWRDGLSHTYYAFGIGIDSSGNRGGNNTLLGSSPKSMTCNGLTTTISGPSTATAGTSAGPYSMSPAASVSNTEIWYTQTNCDYKNNSSCWHNVCNGGGGGCSGNITFPGAGTYIVQAPAFTPGGAACSGNPACKADPTWCRSIGFTYCGDSSQMQVTVSPAIPNCSILSGPSQIRVGQPGSFTANFSSSQGNLGGLLSIGQNGTWISDSSANWSSFNGSTGTASFSWTPTSPGTYDVLCRAWNDGIAECRGKSNYVDGPPRYACAGPNSYKTVTVLPSAPTIVNATINSTTVKPDNVSQYTISVQGSSPWGAADINTLYGLINLQGENGGNYRGYLTWGNADYWPGYKDHKPCSGGGFAVIQPDYGNNYIRLDSCSVTSSGNNRTVSFVVRFDASTPIVNNNDISGWVYNSLWEYDPRGWVNFQTSFNFAAPVNPVGYHDSAEGGTSCVLRGWTCDGDNWSLASPIDFWANDGPGWVWVGSTNAGDWREDAVKNMCGGTSNYHGFNYSVPASWKDGQPHSYYAFGIGMDSYGNRWGDNTLLNGSPKTMTCCSTNTVSGTLTGLQNGNTAKVCVVGTNTCSNPQSNGAYTLTGVPVGSQIEARLVSGSSYSISPGTRSTPSSCSNSTGQDFNFYYTGSGTPITVRAYGSPASGTYPNMQLRIGDETVGNWFVTGSYADYAVNYSGDLNQKLIQVYFTNDLYVNGEDRNLVVDTITVGGVIHSTSGYGIYSSGSWRSNDGCNSGLSRLTNVLACNGYFQVADPNCTLNSVPQTAFVGQTIPISGSFYSPQANLGAMITIGQNGTGVADLNPAWASYNGSAGTANFSWTPTVTGTYDVMCRGWNDGIAECRGKSNYVDTPPRFLCRGPVSTATITVACSPVTATGSISGLTYSDTVKVCIQGTNTCTSPLSNGDYSLAGVSSGNVLELRFVTGVSSEYNITPPTRPITINSTCTPLTAQNFSLVFNCGGSCGTVVTGNGPGVVYYAGAVNSGTGQISRKSGGGNLNWKVNSTFNTSLLNQYKVDPYWASFITNHNAVRLGGVGVGDAVLNNGNDLENNMSSDVNYLFTTNGLKINATQTLTSGRSAIILVNGDLTISGGVTRTNKGSFVAFFVKGSINVDNGLTNGTNPLLDGVFVTDGVFNTGTSPNKTEKFIGNGIFIAYGGFTLQRDLGNTTNQTQPAETFTFDPSLVLNAPSDLSRSNYTWREVAP